MDGKTLRNPHAGSLYASCGGMCTVRKGKQVRNLHCVKLVRLPTKFALHVGVPMPCGHRGIGFLTP